MRKKVFIGTYIIMIAFSLTFCGCKRNESGYHESQDAIEDAIADGRNSAKSLINRQWKDTLELQRILLEVRSRQSKYVIQKRMESAAAFDSAFIGTLRTVRPDIMKHLK